MKSNSEGRCKVCRTGFLKRSISHKVCSPECAAEYAKIERERLSKRQERVEAKTVKDKKDSLQPLSYWLAKAQTAVNKYVRLRDYHLGCVSCDKPASWQGQWHGGHFRSVGSNSYLRFNLWNIHKQCSQCNNHLSGNIANYRPRLESRIGKDRLEFLESSTNTKKYNREYLERLSAIFNKKSRRLEKRLNLG